MDKVVIINCYYIRKLEVEGDIIMSILSLRNVTKKIKVKTILKDVSFDVNEGEIVGFLGPNGAGKTTTIKLILGILTPDEGNIFVRGKNIKNRKVFINELRNISSIVEAPGLYEYLTGFENLEQVARLDNRIKVSDINKLVEEVGLKNSIFNKVKTYSLGMKQKLALVQALITKPKLLILDEPTNGLDPLATVQIRELLKKASTENKVSILISSHILGELEQLCDRVIFINDGRIVKNEKLMGREENRFVLVSKKMAECIRVLKNESFVRSVSCLGDKLIVTILPDSSQKIINVLTRNNIDIEEIYKYHETLEEKYMGVYAK